MAYWDESIFNNRIKPLVESSIKEKLKDYTK